MRAAAVCCLLWTGLAAAQEWLPNGSMAAGAGQPAGWREPTIEEGPGTLRLTRDTVTFQTGPAALRLEAVGGVVKGNVGCALPAIAGQRITVSAWLLAVGDLSFVALAVLVPGGEPSYQALAEIRPSPRWQRVYRQVTVPTGAQPPQLLLLLQGQGTLWLDEVSLQPGDGFRPEPLICDFAAPPLYAFLSWEKLPTATATGVRVAAKDSRGGCGFLVHRELTPFADWVPTLTLTPGPGAQPQALRLGLDDADGTSHEYRFTLPALTAGTAVSVAADDGASLQAPGGVAEVGKVAGFEVAQVRQVRLIGDWSASALDLTFQRLELREPPAEQAAAREKLQQRLAAQAAQRAKAEADRRARLEALLAGAPHPADGPEVQHVAPVAPDVLALWVQEKTFVPQPQVPYVAQEGDEIRRSGERLPVIEDGKLQIAQKDVKVFRKQGNRLVELGDLAVNAQTIKPPDTATGSDLSAESVAEARAYRITALDDPARGEPAAPVAVWWKRKPNAPRSLAFEVQVFLKLPRPLAVGRRYRLDFVGVNFRQASLEYTYQPSQQRSEAVHVSAIGFRPDDPLKCAWLSQWCGTGGPLSWPAGQSFEVLDEATGQSALRGAARLLKGAKETESFKAGRNYTQADVHLLDFSSLNKPGRYRVYVTGIGCSFAFRIDPHVWHEALQLSLRGLLHHRSGLALGPPFTDYVRPRNMHPADGVPVFWSAGSEFESGSQDGAFAMLASRRTETREPEAWGGHMDAGDWDRNGNHPRAMWLLLDLCEQYPAQIGAVKLALPPAEAANSIPDLLDEVIWNLDFHRRLQTAEGGISGGVESTSHPRPGEASWQESEVLSAYAPDPWVSFVYAASTGKLARLLQPFDAPQANRFLASAQRAWTWAVANTARFVDLRAAADRAKATLDLDTVRNLAALELWLTTEASSYHTEFARTTLLRDPGNEIMLQHKAALRYARLPDGQGDAVLRQAARDWILKMAAIALQFGDGNGFGVTTAVPGLPPMGFVGYLSTPEMIGALLPAAYQLTGDRRYLAGAVRACQFASGANPMNLALTTGLGPRPVRHPLHIDSQQTGQPAPAGITVYGISDPAENYAFDAWAYTWYLQKMVPAARTWPTAESYWDIWLVPSSNEFTIHQTIIPSAAYWGFLACRD
ncbi:MAG: glycoside hydrolase family 9 protein [Fimbriimonadaceae bacterium]|nr:glycoside hydrolase family 9 protein [Fimbriimonadaceae bacterium]